MTVFHCRLIAPRPDFAFTMSEAERTTMGEHAAYLSGLAGMGHVVVFGPVADPQGPWGLAIMEAENEQAVKRLLDADPIIKSGLGFHYEILPFMQAAFGKRLQN